MSQALIQNHAHAARLGYWVLVGTGTLALLSLAMLRQGAPRARQLAWATLLGAAAELRPAGPRRQPGRAD
ncbi:MAG: hypothetical protein WKG07_42145 [Hymenobacter sp.]